MALMYIDRCTKKNSYFIIHSKNVIKIAFVALTLAYKYFCEKEELVPNSDFARLLGVPTREFLSLELNLISMMEFDTYVSPKDFD
jgi:hypothetical protein